MSRFIGSEPCKAQARSMKRLGFTSQDTDDGMTAVWGQGFITIHLPAAWEPQDDAEVMRRVASFTYEQGLRAARQQMRAALGMS